MARAYETGVVCSPPARPAQRAVLLRLAECRWLRAALPDQPYAYAEDLLDDLVNAQPIVTSPPIRAIHAAVAAPGAPRMAWSAVAAKLAGDPTIRYTEGGRAFLRRMSGHSMQSDEWREFVDAIPQHWLDEVSRIAVSMSEEWREFADRLGNKMEAAS